MFPRKQRKKTKRQECSILDGKVNDKGKVLVQTEVAQKKGSRYGGAPNVKLVLPEEFEDYFKRQKGVLDNNTK